MSQVNWDDVDQLPEGGNKTWFDVGVFEVLIDETKRGQNSNGTPYFTFSVIDNVDPDITAPLERIKKYTSDKAVGYTMQFLQSVLVHNAKAEAQKEVAKKYMHSLSDSDNFDIKKLHGAQAWLKVTQSDRENPNGGYYNNYELYAYEPKVETVAPKTATTATDLVFGKTDQVDISEVPFN
jgi:hypothetical protein